MKYTKEQFATKLYKSLMSKDEKAIIIKALKKGEFSKEQMDYLYKILIEEEKSVKKITKEQKDFLPSLLKTILNTDEKESEKINKFFN